MPDPRSAVPESLPWLNFVATGGQSHLFGTDAWVVKIPRWSWQTPLGRVLVHPRTPAAALEVLGGLMEPFALLKRAAFRGPRVVRGRPMAGPGRLWRTRWAMAGPRHPAGDFLDRRIYRARPAEAARLMLALLDTLEAIRARGWHVLDFIMSNFVVGPDGCVRLVDAGLLIPSGHLRGPSQQICSRVFVRRMVPDYLEVLEAVAARHPGDARGLAALRVVMGGCGPRFAAWRAGRAAVPAVAARPTPVVFPPGVGDEIFAGLGPLHHKLPLTPRLPSGYTAPHHAIPSEN